MQKTVAYIHHFFHPAIFVLSDYLVSGLAFTSFTSFSVKNLLNVVKLSNAFIFHTDLHSHSSLFTNVKYIPLTTGELYRGQFGRVRQAPVPLLHRDVVVRIYVCVYLCS